MKKRLLSVLALTLAVLICLPTFAACDFKLPKEPEDTEKEETTTVERPQTEIETDYSDSFTEGLTFSRDRKNNVYSVTGYEGSAKTVIVPAVYMGLPVTSIAKNAFFKTEAEVVKLPDSIKVIGENAFKSSDSLKEIYIGSQEPELEEIGKDAFFSCRNLEYIYYFGTRDEWNEIKLGYKWDGTAGTGTEKGVYTLYCVDDDEIETEPDDDFELSLPVEGYIAKAHDPDLQVWSNTYSDYRVHLGIDIETKRNAPVLAAADGVVYKVWVDAFMGQCVAISHGDSIITFYKNLSTELADGIEEGATVACGQEIGKVGETAVSEIADEPHLHFEMTVDDIVADPMDYFSEEAKDALENYLNGDHTTEQTDTETDTDTDTETETETTEPPTPFDTYFGYDYFDENYNIAFANKEIHDEDGVNYVHYEIIEGGAFESYHNYKGTLKGHYVVYKYRTDIPGGIQINTTTNTDLKGPTVNTHMNVETKSDGQWHTLVVDLTELMVDRKTGEKYVEAGKELSFFRIDHINIVKVGYYLDIAFVALCDDLADAKDYLIDEPAEEDTESQYIHPESGYVKSELAYAAGIDFINGYGQDGESSPFPSIRSSNKRGVATIEHNSSTVNGTSILCFAGWAVVESGVSKFIWSADGGNTWYDAFLYERESFSDANEAILNVASNMVGKDLSAYGEACVFQGGFGKPQGVAANLSAYAGETVDVTFAAIPKDDPDGLCLLLHVANVVVEVCEHEANGYEFDETSHWYSCVKCGEAIEKEDHKYEYNVDADSHWLECTVCGATADDEEHAAVDGMTYDAETMTYIGTCKCGMEIRSSFLVQCEGSAVKGMASVEADLTDGDGTSYTRYSNESGRMDQFFYLYMNGTEKSGQYLVVRFRVSEGYALKHFGNSYVGTVHGGNAYPSGMGDACSTIGSVDNTTTDWQICVIDLSKTNAATCETKYNEDGSIRISAKYIPDNEGEYYTRYLRCTLPSGEANIGSYMDVDFVAFADNIDAIRNFIQTEHADDCLHTETKRVFYANLAAYVKKCFYCNTELSITGFKAVLSLGNDNFIQDTSNEYYDYSANDGAIRIECKSTPTVRERFASFKSIVGQTGRYLVVKYRACENLNNCSLQFYTNTVTSGPIYENRETRVDFMMTGDEKWHVKIIDLDKEIEQGGYFSQDPFVSTDPIQCFRFDYINAWRMDVGDYVEYAYIGLADTLDGVIVSLESLGDKQYCEHVEDTDGVYWDETEKAYVTPCIYCGQIASKSEFID